MIKNKKVIKGIIVVLIIILIGATYFTIQMLTIKPVETNNKDQLKYTLEEKYTTNNLYCNINSNSILKDECEKNYKGTYSIKVENKNAKTLAADNLTKRYILYDDNTLKIYDTYKKEIINLNIENKYTNYQILLDSNLEKPTALILTNKENNTKELYNILSQEMINLKDTTNEEFYDKTKTFDGKYIVATNKTGTPHYDYFINVITKERVLKGSDYEKDNSCSETDSKVIKSNDKYYFYVSCTAASSHINEKFYNEEGKLIIDMNSDTSIKTYFHYSVNNGYLYVANKDTILKYDNTGKLLETNEDYKDIVQLANNYVFYLDSSKKLTITNLDTKETSTLLDLSNKENFSFDNWNFDIYNESVNYYQNKVYKYFDLLKPGMYFTIKDNDKSQKYYYNLETKEISELNS